MGNELALIKEFQLYLADYYVGDDGYSEVEEIDEYLTPIYAVKPILKYIPTKSKVWCPFDTENSLIVKELNNHGCIVTQTHIEMGNDFFETEPKEGFIISNPPYSKKGEVFERLFSFDNPFAMLVGVVGIFESKRRFNIFKSNDFEIMYLSSRVSYYRNYSDLKTVAHPPFSSVWITRNVLPNRIVFEEINRR